jgi:ribosomal protein S18 acetylase RimI-like enzyme
VSMVIGSKVGGLELLPEIKPLWERLNALNVERSENFSEQHRHLGFETRMMPVLDKARAGLCRIEMSIGEGGAPIGYCVATIDRDYLGEVDSLYVDEGHRDHGLGSDLLDRSVDWMMAFPVRRVVLSVTVGNLDAPRFYMRHGFHPRNTIFEMKMPRP